MGKTVIREQRTRRGGGGEEWSGEAIGVKLSIEETATPHLPPHQRATQSPRLRPIKAHPAALSRPRPYGRLGVLIFVLLMLCFPPIVYADGGAPDLAYVAGTSQGVSIIDIAKQQVAGTVSLAGDPHTILLSPDGRFLYVTQPAMRRIAVVAAKTGQTIC